MRANRGMYSRIVIPANAGIQGLNLNQQSPLPSESAPAKGWGEGEKYKYLPP